MGKVKVREDTEKITAWQINLFQKNPTEKIIHYKKTQKENYESLGGMIAEELFFDTELKIESGPTYLYELGEFKVTKHLSGYALGGGPSYYFSYSFPQNKDLIKKNEKVIGAVEKIVGKIIIKR